MKKKIKNLWKTLLLCTALTVTSCVTPVMAAQADDTENSTPEEPEKPESYEWEIDSNSIPGWPCRYEFIILGVFGGVKWVYIISLL